MILRLTDGTTTVNLVGGTDGIATATPYAPVAPTQSSVDFSVPALQDGGEVFEVTYRQVTESVELTIKGTDQATMLANKQAFERLLTQAANRQRRRAGPKVYVEYRYSDSGDVYRSELMTGRFEPARTTMTVGHRCEPIMQGLLTWRRRFFWEGQETSVSISNQHGSGTGGVTVYNQRTASFDNFIEISAGVIEGDIPAPLVVGIENTYVSGVETARVYIAQSVFRSIGLFLEGENVASGGSSVADPNSSGGFFRRFPVTTAWVRLGNWTLSNADLAALGGEFFRGIGRVLDAPSGMVIKLKLMYPFAPIIVVGDDAPEVNISTTPLLQNFGALRIPPWLRDKGGQQQLALALWGKADSAGDLDLDYLQMSPMEGYADLLPQGFFVATGDELFYDAAIQDVWVDDLSGGIAGYYIIRSGNNIKLWPGQNQFLTFLTTGQPGGTSEIDRTSSIKVWYRPRKLTL